MDVETAHGGHRECRPLWRRSCSHPCRATAVPWGIGPHLLYDAVDDGAAIEPSTALLLDEKNLAGHLLIASRFVPLRHVVLAMTCRETGRCTTPPSGGIIP